MVQDALATNDDDLVVTYNGLVEKLAAIDEVLNAASDSKSAGKRAIRTALVDKYENDSEENGISHSWKGPLTALVARINELPTDAQKFATYVAFVRGLTEAFGKDEEAFVTALVDSQPKVERVEVDPDQLAALSTQRSATYKSAVAIFNLIDIMGLNADGSVKAPKKRTGSVGKRGSRAITNFDWFVNGEALDAERNKLLWVAREFGYENAAELRKAMAASLNLPNLQDPPDTITFTLKEGSVLTGRKRADLAASTEPVDSPDDDDDDDDDDEDDENVTV